jgi:integrase
MRRGELFHLKWSDVDFSRKILTVQGATAKSRKTRHIPLSLEAFDVLNRFNSQSQGNELVFPDDEGGLLTTIYSLWQNLMKDARIENFRFHDCRHDFASQLVMKGVDLNTVRELLGHRTIEMTLRYAHLAPEKLAAAIAMLD